MSRDDKRVSQLRRDGDPTARPQRKGRAETFSATGSDVGTRCSKCGRPVGFIEGGVVVSALCNRCAGLSFGEEDPRMATFREGERLRTTLTG